MQTSHPSSGSGYQEVWGGTAAPTLPNFQVLKSHAALPFDVFKGSVFFINLSFSFSWVEHAAAAPGRHHVRRERETMKNYMAGGIVVHYTVQVSVP